MNKSMPSSVHSWIEFCSLPFRFAKGSAVSRISNPQVRPGRYSLPTGSRRYSRLETCATQPRDLRAARPQPKLGGCSTRLKQSWPPPGTNWRTYGGFFDVPGAQKRVGEINALMAADTFWNSRDQAQELIREAN